jgi:hypothetical protein
MLAVIEPTIVLRPHPFAPHLRSRWRRALWYLPLAVLGFARLPPVERLVTLAAGLATGAVIWWFALRIRLALVDGLVRRTSWWGRKVSCAVASIADVVELTAIIAWTGPPETWLLFRDDRGETIMRAAVSSYPPEDVEVFLEALDRPVTRIPRILKVKEVRREFPGSFHWPWAHYWLDVRLRPLRRLLRRGVRRRDRPGDSLAQALVEPVGEVGALLEPLDHRAQAVLAEVVGLHAERLRQPLDDLVRRHRRLPWTMWFR